jgi:hypothetical protein
MAVIMSQPQDQQPLFAALVGRSFVHPIFDYLLIGGVLSLVVLGIVALSPAGTSSFTTEQFTYFILLSNSAHFAASTVRLYTKPGTQQSLPFVTMALPLVVLAVLTLCMFRADSLGPHFRALYLTWSPYHYAAQAYGLAVMYSYRSGCLLSVTNKRLLWWVSMLPFFYSFLLAPRAGIHWLDVGRWLDDPTIVSVLTEVRDVMPGLAFAAVGLLFWRIWRSEARPMPVISALMLITNGFWWFVFPPMQAFVWATIFHGIQYLTIVIIFHVKDQMNQPGNRRGTLYHVLSFYGASLLLGYGLFDLLPELFVFSGFAAVESMMLVVAAINIHHFIVDAFIWRLKSSDNNRGIVDSTATVAV